MKNLNSIKHIKKAIEYEISRITERLLQGQPIIQQTRSFDADNDTTFALRDKEEANDYRYFPDPDLAPFVISAEALESYKASLPELPNALHQRLLHMEELTEYDAQQLSDDLFTAQYFEEVSLHTSNKKSIANWMLGPLRQWLNDNQLNFSQAPISPANLAQMIDMIESGELSFSTAVSRLLPALIKEKKSPRDLAETLNILQTANESMLAEWIQEVMNKMPDKVQEYRKGKKGLLGVFIGEVKKISGGKADPQKVTQLLQEKLNQP